MKWTKRSAPVSGDSLLGRRLPLEHADFSRRSFLQGLLATIPIIRGHGQINPPLPVPDSALILYNGGSSKLFPLVNGHVTAVQLMFTACTTTCPMQAAIFERVQKLLPGMRERGIQLLSLSIDPENDTPKELASWRKRFHAKPNWIAAAPTLGDAPQLQAFFGKGSDSADHSTQVHILDRHGRLVWRTFELPAAEEVSGVLQRI